MSNYDVLFARENNGSKENNESTGISEVIEEIINRVESMTCTKAIPSNKFLDSSTESPCKSDDTNKSKFDNSIERAKRRRHRSGSRKNRVRHRKHKWKPYHKLTGVERRRLEERISRRAYRSREKMSASGLTLAPYNTTQFLMDDHYNGEPDYESIQHECKNRDDYNSSEDYYSSPDDEEEFIQQQFSETYDTIHDAYINDMCKSDLVRELIRLEDEIERLEQSLRDVSEEKKSELDVDAELEKIQVFEVEIKKLTRENLLLQQKNEMLQKQLSKIKAN